MVGQQVGEAEKKPHEAAVEGLAQSLCIEVEEVQSLYEAVLAEMRREAIIMDFLPIFAVRKVKDRLLLKRTSSET